MDKDGNCIDYTYVATNIAEWVERNYGYFVNKNSDKVEIIKDFANQLSRLDPSLMSYIEQAKNNFFDNNLSSSTNYDYQHPPNPLMFVRELKNCSIKTQERTEFIDKMRLVFNRLHDLPTDSSKIQYIKELVEEENPQLKKISIVTMEIETILKRNGFNDCEIRNMINAF